MAGRAYRPADLLEISWRDLQWVELQRHASPSQREELPVQEEVVEDEAGVISSVIVPTLEPVAEDARLLTLNYARGMRRRERGVKVQGVTSCAGRRESLVVLEVRGRGWDR